jgi:heterodisulfide reductase subunit C
MIDWGYSINKDSQIDFDSNDRSLAEYLKSKEPSFSLCLNCGSCTATCTTGNFTELNIRMLYTLIRRGETKGLKEKLEDCMLCGKCILVCPSGVNTRNVIRLISKELQKTNN